MAIEVFNRQELKFLIDEVHYAQLIKTIQAHMHPDVHNKNNQTYRLYNLYIDTVDSSLIRHSLSKPVYKEKLRIRSYRPFTDSEKVFLEVKKRYKRITNKRRTKMTYTDALDFIATGTMHESSNEQVMHELQTMVRAQQYYPQTFITYDRRAFSDNNVASDLRVTFDTNVLIRRFDQIEEERLLPDGRIIMEVKSCYNIPLWLVAALSELGVYKQGYSKYGNEYLHRLRGAHHA